MKKIIITSSLLAMTVSVSFAGKEGKDSIPSGIQFCGKIFECVGTPPLYKLSDTSGESQTTTRCGKSIPLFKPCGAFDIDSMKEKE